MRNLPSLRHTLAPCPISPAFRKLRRLTARQGYVFPPNRMPFCGLKSRLPQLPWRALRAGWAIVRATISAGSIAPDAVYLPYPSPRGNGETVRTRCISGRRKRFCLSSEALREFRVSQVPLKVRGGVAPFPWVRPSVPRGGSIAKKNLRKTPGRRIGRLFIALTGWFSGELAMPDGADIAPFPERGPFRRCPHRCS